MKKSGSDGHSPRVLLVDDDDDLADALRQSLNDAGYAVATVRHGAAALELVRQIAPDVILLDLTMPIMDGWSFVSQYRRGASPSARIILLTGHPNGRDISNNLGADGYVAKPFELSALIAELRANVGEATATS
jgi:DNA-binding response OmpR family regulator